MLGCLFALVCVLSLSTSAVGDIPQVNEPLVRAEGRARMVYAMAHRDFEIPRVLDYTLTAVGSQILQDMFGGHGAPQAVTYPNGHIYIDQRLDYADVYVETILEHELIHVLQYLHKGPIRSCQEWLARETEAYLAQAQQLDAMHDVRGMMVRRTLASLRCND
mgnify:CR=1 FL=1